MSCLGFLYIMGFCKSRYLYVYGGLNWFPIRDSCLSLSLIGDPVYVAISILFLVYIASWSFCYFVSLFSVLSLLK